MSREREFIKNSIILSVGTIFPKFTSIITLPIITGCLTKTEYGTYDIITILVSLFLPIATVQMQAAAFRYLVGVRDNFHEQKVIITNITLFTIPVCICALVILYFFLGSIQFVTRILIILYFLIDTFLITLRQIARGLEKNTVYSISALINSVLEMVLMAFTLLALKWGLNGAVLSLLTSQFFSAVFVIFRIKLLKYIDVRLFSINQIKIMISYSWPMIPNSLSSWVMRVSDRIILSLFMGVEANAIYAVANKLPNMFNIVQNTFSLAWQENAALTVEDKDSGEYYGKMFDNVYNVFVSIMAMLIAFTPVLFRVLIQGEYEEAYNHMPILYIGVLFATMSSYVGGIYIAHMKSKQIGITTTLAAISNFLINIVFVRKIGIYAASLSTTISYFGLALFRMIDVQKIQKIRFNYIRITVLTLLLVLMSAVCFMRNPILNLVNIAVSIIIAIYLNKSIVFAFVRKAKQKIMK